MKRGPKPKPAAKARKQGNPGHRPIKEQPKVEPADDSIPKFLEVDARAIWSSLMPTFLALGYFLDTDKLAFARYCDHTARWLRMRRKVDKTGETYETRSKHGRMKRINPDFQAMLMLEEKIARLEDRFGLSPVQREAILSRMQEPKAPLIAKAPTAGDPSPAGGMPKSPLGMLSPDQFRRPTGTGGTH